MKIVELKAPHDFHKENLVTMKGGYDIMKCRLCGIKGKRRGVNPHITVPNNTSENLIKFCDGSILKNDGFVGNFIQVTKCTISNPVFDNLTPNSIHQIVQPPKDYFNGDRGVWVQGIGEPVKLLFDEYNDYEGKVRTKKKPS